MGKGSNVTLSGIDLTQVTSCTCKTLVFLGCYANNNALDIIISPKSMSIAGKPIDITIEGVKNPSKPLDLII